MLEIKVLGRRDCHLCKVVMKMARRMQDDIGFKLTGITIDDDPELSYQYGTKVPVVLIDNVEALWGRVKEGELRRAIKRARWRRPVSRILSRLRTRLRRG